MSGTKTCDYSSLGRPVISTNNQKLQDKSLANHGGRASNLSNWARTPGLHWLLASVHRRFITSSFGSVISSIAERKPSRPNPESLTPPYGM